MHAVLQHAQHSKAVATYDLVVIQCTPNRLQAAQKFIGSVLHSGPESRRRRGTVSGWPASASLSRRRRRTQVDTTHTHDAHARRASLLLSSIKSRIYVADSGRSTRACCRPSVALVLRVRPARSTSQQQASCLDCSAKTSELCQSAKTSELCQSRCVQLTRQID